jgi:hypothetical protein
MCNSLKILTTVLLVLAAATVVTPGRAAPSHEQTISKQTAEAFCKDHGGGTTCDFCHDNHCHNIGCDSDGSCYNRVYRQGSTSGPGSPGRVGTAPATVGIPKVKSGITTVPVKANPVTTGSEHDTGVTARRFAHDPAHLIRR